MTLSQRQVRTIEQLRRQNPHARVRLVTVDDRSLIATVALRWPVRRTGEGRHRTAIRYLPAGGSHYGTELAALLHCDDPIRGLTPIHQMEVAA